MSSIRNRFSRSGRRRVTPAVANVGGVSPVSHHECGRCAGCPFKQFVANMQKNS